MSQIARLRDAEISNGNLINADDIDAELNQLVAQDNAQDLRITAIESGDGTIAGNKIFSSNITVAGINEAVIGSGVAIDGTRLYDGYINIAPIIGTVSLTTPPNVATDIITLTAAVWPATGTAVKYRADKGAVIDTGISETTTYYARQVTTSSGTLHPTLTDATNNTNILNITAQGSGTRQLIYMGNTPRESDIWADSTGFHWRLGGVTYTGASSVNSPLPVGYHGSGCPTYVNSTSFTVASIAERDSTNSVNISKTTSTTVNMTTTGLNGNAISANLSGTIYVPPSGATLNIASFVAATDVATFTSLSGVSNGAAVAFMSSGVGGLTTAVVYYLGSISGNTAKLYTTRAAAIAGTGNIDLTGSTSTAIAYVNGVYGTGTTFTADLSINDFFTVTSAIVLRVAGVTNDTILTVSFAPLGPYDNVTYQRGIGSVAQVQTGVAAFLYLYAITDGTTPGLLVSSRNLANGQTLVDLPTGYTSYRQMPFALTLLGTLSGVIPFYVLGWPSNAPSIFYDVIDSHYNGTSNVTGTTNTGYTTGTGTVSSASTITGISNFVPPGNNLVFLNFANLAATIVYAQVSNNSGTLTTSTGFGLVIPGTLNLRQGTPFKLDASQQLYLLKNGSGNITPDVLGYVFTAAT